MWKKLTVKRNILLMKAKLMCLPNSVSHGPSGVTPNTEFIGKFVIVWH